MPAADLRRPRAAPLAGGTHVLIVVCRNPGVRGSNIGQNAGRPVALIAASVTPWYARLREMIVILSGLPRAFQ